MVETEEERQSKQPNNQPVKQKYTRTQNTNGKMNKENDGRENDSKTKRERECEQTIE